MSPAELMFGRKIKTTIPTVNTNREIDLDEWRKNEDWKKVKSQVYYNKRNRTKKIEDLNEGDQVWVYLIRKRSEPREYDVEIEGRVLRRNTSQMIYTWDSNRIGDEDECYYECEKNLESKNDYMREKQKESLGREEEEWN